MQRIFIVLLGFVVLLGVCVTAFSIYKDGPSAQVSDTQLATTSSATVSSEQDRNERIIPEGLREYRSADYHFSLFYPQELSVAEYSEGGGAMSVTFQNEQEVKGFQIFMVPYAESQVSEARFKQDEPSGARTNLNSVIVDGATGAAFYSTDADLGETREIWFVHDGYLYEVTTLKPLDTWLTDIMQSWKFI